MQSPALNLKYAQSISELSSQLPAAQAAGPQAVTDLLIGYGDYDFGLGAWYWTTQCTATLRAQMDSNAPNVTGAYADCLGAGPETLANRTIMFQSAQKALGVKQ